MEKAQPRARRSASQSASVAPVEAEETEAVEEEPVSDGADAPAAGRRLGRRPTMLNLIGAALAVLVVAALVLSVLEWTGANSRYNSSQSLRRSALDAASTYGGYLSSYDYHNLNGPGSSWSEVDAHSTPHYRKDFDATKADLSSLVTDYKATAKGKVIAAGLSSVSSSRAVALLFIDQTITNTAQKPGTTTQPLRVQLVMVRQGGKWLIDDLQVPN